MKKINIGILLLLFGLSCFTATAQNVFGPVGAEWHFMDNEKSFDIWAGVSIPDKSWNDHVVVTGDTTIAGQACRILQITRSWKSATFQGVVVNGAVYEYVYDNTDTTFYYDKDSLQFYPLYVWNVQQGDTLRLPHFSRAGHVFMVVIDSVANALYDNVALKTYYTSAFVDTVALGVTVNWGGRVNTSSPDGTLKFNGSYVEKIGGWRGIFPSFHVVVPDGRSEIRTPAGINTCYQDSTVNLHLAGAAACDFIPATFYTSIADIQRSVLQVAVFPNPAKGRVAIQSKVAFTAGSWLTVTDISGRQMAPAIALGGKSSTTFSVADWKSGLYLMKFVIGGYTYFQKLQVWHE